MATLIVDDREQTVSPFLAGKNVPFLIKRITTGDFCIVRQNPNNPAEDRILAVFERKSMNDFAASIKDGRYENYHNMIELQKENDDLKAKLATASSVEVTAAKVTPLVTGHVENIASESTDVRGLINKLGKD